MAEKHERKIGSREIIGITSAMLITKATDTTPTILFKAGYNAGWVIPILSSLVMVVPILFTLSLLKRYEDKSLIDIIYNLTGKYIGFIIGLILFYILFSSLFYNSRSYMDIMNSMFYPKTPMLILYFTLFMVICFMAYLGIGVIGNTAWIFYSTIISVFLALLLLAQKGINFTFLYPLEGAGIPKLLKTSLSASTIWADIFYFFIIFPIIRDKKSFKKTILLSFGLSVAGVAVAMVVYIITFGYPSIVYINYPFQELTRTARFGSYFTHPEAFYLGFWSIAAIIRYAAYLYFVTATLGYVLRLKNFKPLLLTISAWVFALGMLPENFVVNIFVIREELLAWGWIVFTILPAVLWIISMIKGDYAK